MRESTIEARGTMALKELFGIVSIKVGHDGWPDRLCLCRDGLHFWIEYKTPTGKLEPAQRVRINELLDRGDFVYVCISPAEAVAAAKNCLRLEGAQAPLPLPGSRRAKNG